MKSFEKFVRSEWRVLAYLTFALCLSLIFRDPVMFVAAVFGVSLGMAMR